MSLRVCAVVSGLSLSVSIFCSIQWLIMLTKKMLIRHVVVSLLYLVVKCTCAACDFSVFLSLTVVVCVMFFAYPNGLPVYLCVFWVCGFGLLVLYICVYLVQAYCVCCAHFCVVLWLLLTAQVMWTLHFSTGFEVWQSCASLDWFWPTFIG